MNAQRRTRWNFGLEYAVDRARELELPLLVLEALSASYRWASHRHHVVAIDGMRDNARACAEAGIAYHPYVEPEVHAGRGLVVELASQAALVVTDHWPGFHIPHWIGKVARTTGTRVEAIDSCGLLPVALAGKPYSRAFDFRRHVQRHAAAATAHMPTAEPLDGHGTPALPDLPACLRDRWPATDLDDVDLDALPIDARVPAVEGFKGGMSAAAERLDAFIDDRLGRYLERNNPNIEAASGLSPYLHWGHVSSHEIVARVLERDDWDPSEIENARPTGKREGFWGTSPEVESFLDELVTWREVCLNTAHERPADLDRFEGLPEFAIKTLTAHEDDPRPHVYSLEEFDAAETHDSLWNAAQNQLRHEGVIHNYLRMLWGKKILHWAESPRQALDVMIELNNRYALDGRDANSYGGIMWVLGRYDRPWGPERPIFGKVRYMTSDNTRRKMKVDAYVERYATAPTLFD